MGGFNMKDSTGVVSVDVGLPHNVDFTTLTDFKKIFDGIKERTSVGR